MLALRTAVIRHTTAHGVHHDWLIEDPRLPDPQAPHARLWTARVAPPPGDWTKLPRLELTVIAPHRRHYLAYQGPVSGGRGRVQRVLTGVCYAPLWTKERIVLSLDTTPGAGQWQIERLGPQRWRGRQWQT